MPRRNKRTPPQPRFYFVRYLPGADQPLLAKVDRLNAMFEAIERLGREISDDVRNNWSPDEKTRACQLAHDDLMWELKP